ncbi:cell surface glycoprotein [Haloferax mucosum ATCC BAA-1512]|uniref:Cell surface glycoprotein n=1 Tax=Haloferax mucosum ATCC BAA-1512 TaxID=662479 RepID=M0IMB1_9EURY|nr:cell surface glycoprotein [Haloferax mucosum ATCC BAA-1512]
MVAAVLLAAVAPPSLGASGDYDIDIGGSIDTADRTVSTQWGDFTVTQVGRADTDSSVSISVDAPSAAQYSVAIYDTEQNIRRVRTRTGDTTATFDTDGLEPGTYAVTVGEQSSEEVHAVEPLVIRAYSLSVTANDTVENGDGLDVTTELEQVESGEPVEAVQVVLSNGDKHVRSDASKINDSHYSATVPTDDFDTGDYSLYAVVRSDDRALGEDELVGVSDASTVEIVEQTDETPETPTPGGGGGSGGDGGDTSDGDSPDGDSSDSGNETATPTSNNTTDTPTPTPNSTTTTDSPPPTDTTETTQSSPTTAPPTTTDNVVTPNEPTTTEPSTTSSDVPNTALQALFGILVVFAVGRRLVRR